MGDTKWDLLTADFVVFACGLAATTDVFLGAGAGERFVTASGAVFTAFFTATGADGLVGFFEADLDAGFAAALGLLKAFFSLTAAAFSENLGVDFATGFDALAAGFFAAVLADALGVTEERFFNGFAATAGFFADFLVALAGTFFLTGVAARFFAFIPRLLSDLIDWIA